MSKVWTIPKEEWETALREDSAYRCEIGLFVYRNDLKAVRATWLSYSDCVAVAALIIEGYDPKFAAALVGHDVVYAAPHLPGCTIEPPINSDPVGQTVGGTYRLPDGSLWNVFGDLDFGSITASDLPLDYEKIVATRALAIVDESPEDRVRHLFTRCDEFGRLAA